jgi:hypothetical protein
MPCELGLLGDPLVVLVFVLDAVTRDAVIARKQPHNFVRSAGRR